MRFRTHRGDRLHRGGADFPLPFSPTKNVTSSTLSVEGSDRRDREGIDGDIGFACAASSLSQPSRRQLLLGHSSVLPREREVRLNRAMSLTYTVSNGMLSA